MGVIFEFFHSSGTCPRQRDALKMAVKTEEMEPVVPPSMVPVMPRARRDLRPGVRQQVKNIVLRAPDAG